MDNRIYLKTWLELKPYNKQTVSDRYYLKICNDVKNTIFNNAESFVLQMYLEKNEIDYLACFLTSYFEDLISKTNIWNSFVTLHQSLYKKQLPFYVLDDYFEEEINIQDLNFLIWYFINTIQEEKFISPINDFIFKIAENVMNIFEGAWDYAPENQHLNSFYKIDENEEDYYVARKLIDTILFKTYLFFPDTLLKLRKQELEIIEDSKEDEHIMTFLNENKDRTIHKIHTRLLSLKGKEWVAEILGKKHKLSNCFLSISKKISGFFLYKGQNQYDVFIEHIASSKKFKLTKKSFDQSNALSEIDSILFIGIVQWRDEWWFSGIYLQQSFNADLILDEKKSLKSRMAVNFLEPKDKIDEALKLQLDAFKEFNNGSLIAFITSDKIDGFVKSFTDHFNDSLNLSLTEKKQAMQRARKEGFFDTVEKQQNYEDISESALVFFNPKSGIEIAFDVNCAFPISNNPFFEIEYSERAIMFLFCSTEMSTELVMFCIDNCKEDLPFFNNEIGMSYLKEIDFLLRFWKKESYYAKPEITYTGKKTN